MPPGPAVRPGFELGNSVMPIRRTLAVALLCALPVLPAFAADEAAAAPTIKWVNPWKAGTTLTYAAEDIEIEIKAGNRQHDRTTSNETVRITQATADGFQQTWTSTDPRYDVIEGDKSLEPAMRDMAAKLEDLAVVIALDKDGNYAKMENVAEVASRLREATRPIVALSFEQQIAKQDGKVDEEARKKAAALMEGVLDRMTQPAMVEAMVGRDIQSYNGFVGIDIEPDQAYELQTELPNPMGGPSFPAKLTFSLSVSEEDPDDLFVAFEQTIDPEKGAKAAQAVAESLIGEEHKDKLEGAIKAIDIKDEGLFVVHRPTGVVEMFESTRTTKIADQEKIERRRMRLTNGEHEHLWKDEQETTDAAHEHAEGDA